MSNINRRDMNLIMATGVASLVVFMSTAEAAIPPGHRHHPTKGFIEMTKELRDLTAEHFETMVGETFEIGGQKTVLRAVRRGLPTPERFRDQFALTFDTPEGTRILSDVVAVSHPAIGRHDLLVTQVVHSTMPTALEICFG